MFATTRVLWPIAVAAPLACSQGGARDTISTADGAAGSPAPKPSSVPDAGDASAPPREFVPAKDISDDVDYLWKEGSGYRVTLLFDQHGRSKKTGRPGLAVDRNEPAWESAGREVVTFGEHLFDGLGACRTPAGELALGHGPDEYLALGWRGAYVGKDRRMECQKHIARRRFYAEALGGKLELVAAFDDRKIILTGAKQTDEVDPDEAR